MLNLARNKLAGSAFAFIEYRDVDISSILIGNAPIRIRELIRIPIGVAVAAKVPSGSRVDRDRINAQERSECRVVIALNTLTRRESAPPTMRGFDAARLGECWQP